MVDAVLPYWYKVSVASIRETVLVIVRDETVGGTMTIVGPSLSTTDDDMYVPTSSYIKCRTRLDFIDFMEPNC